MLKQINGDLLKIESGIILHQVNCIGATGGLAGALKRKWPDAFKSYRAHCHPDAIGDVVVGVASYNNDEEGSFKLLIAHVFGQYYPGPNTDLAAVKSALYKLARQLKRDEFKDVPVYAPFKMGCGLGGGDWSEYEPLIEQFLPQTIIVNNER